MKEIKIRPIGIVKNNVKQHKYGGFLKEVSEVGIFACRCPARPNPIAITTVKLIKRNKNKIIVEGLDVLNNTPVLDIKPYWSQYDLAENAKVPEWVCKLKF